MLDDPFEMPLAISGSSSVGVSCFVLSLAAVTEGRIWLAHQYKMLESTSCLLKPFAGLPEANMELANTTIPSQRPKEMVSANCWLNSFAFGNGLQEWSALTDWQIDCSPKS